MSIRDWIDEAQDFIVHYAGSVGQFSANDLWEAGLPPTSNRRNLSIALLGLERDGEIVRAGRTRSVGGHGQPILVWRAA